MIKKQYPQQQYPQQPETYNWPQISSRCLAWSGHNSARHRQQFCTRTSHARTSSLTSLCAATRNYQTMYPYRTTSLPPPRRRRRPRLFTKDIETILYAMGDGPISLDSTVNCLEDCLVEFLTDLSHESLQYARSHGRSRVKTDDIPFALRNDPQKLGRMYYITEQLAKIAKAKRMYDTNNVNEKELFADDDDDEEPEKKKSKKEKKGRKKKNTANVSFNDSNESE